MKADIGVQIQKALCAFVSIAEHPQFVLAA